MAIQQRSQVKGFGQSTNEKYIVLDVNDIITELNSGLLPSFLEYNDTDKTIWNNGKGNILSNTSFGPEALKSNTTGENNVALGWFAMANSTTLKESVAIGVAALGGATGGERNVAIGFAALAASTSNISEQVAIGYNCFTQSTGASNVGIGFRVGFANTTGSNNSFVGNYSGSSNTIGSQNTFVGANSGLNNTVGNNNILIGFNSASGNFSGSVVIGMNALATADNQFVVGSSGVNAGAVTTETVTSTRTWSVIINGVARKILLA